MPSGSARVRTTAIVCGRQSASTTKHAVLGLADAPAERHRLGGGGRLVEQRRVRDRQAGQVGDHRLEVEQRLEPALRDLRLVRRVGRVPGGVLEHVAQDDRRRDGAVVAQADHRRHHLVAVGERAQLGEHVGLGLRGAAGRDRDAIRIAAGTAASASSSSERVAERARASAPASSASGPDVAAAEGDCVLELGEGRERLRVVTREHTREQDRRDTRSRMRERVTDAGDVHQTFAVIAPSSR